MKKTIFTLAILGSLSSTAYAETSAITLYGIVDAGIAREDNGGGVKQRVDSGGQSGSRFGFKGTEALGDGLSIIFTLENGYSVDDGTTTQSITTVPATPTTPAQTRSRLFGRQAWLGLSGDFGAVKLGRQNTPVRNVLEAIDPFGLGLAGDITRMFSDNGGGFRMDNTVNYSTPAFAGFSGQVAYGFGEVAGSTSSLRQLGFSAGYANGPLNVLIAHHGINNAAVIGGINQATLLGATYDFAVVKAHVGYGWNKTDTSVITTEDSRDLMLGISVPFGASTVMSSYINHSDRLTANHDYLRGSIMVTLSITKQ